MALYKPRYSLDSRFFGSADGGNYEPVIVDNKTGNVVDSLDYSRYPGTGGMSPEWVKKMQGERDKHLRSIVDTYGETPKAVQMLLDATEGDFTRVKQLGLLPNADWNQMGELGSSWQSAHDPGTMGDMFNQFLVGAGALLAGGTALNALGAQTAGGAFAGGAADIAGSVGTEALAGAGTDALAGGLTEAELAGLIESGVVGEGAGAIEAAGMAGGGLTAAEASALGLGSSTIEGGANLVSAASGASQAAGAANAAANVLDGGADWGDVLKGVSSGLGSGLIGAGVGGLLGAIGGGSKPAGTTTSVQDIPEWQKKVLFPAFEHAGDLLNKQMKAGDFALLDPARQQLMNTINGQFLSPDSNPYLRQYGQALAEDTAAPITGLFAGAGRYGGGAHQGVIGREVGTQLSKLYGGAYENERTRMNQASLLGPDFESAAVGTQWSPLKNFMGIAGGNFGGTQTNPYFNNQMGNVLGGALIGSQLFS